jgi:hypothetical protein
LGQSGVFARIQATVLRVEAEAKAKAQQGVVMAGADKKAAVVAEVKVIGIDIASWLVNLLIELAVAKLNTKQA